MNKKFRFPRKTVLIRSPSPESSGESSTDDEANEVEREPNEVEREPPFDVRIRACAFVQFQEDDSADGETTDNEATDSEATDSEATDSEETDNEDNEVARESPKVPRMRDMAPEPSDGEDSTDSDATSPEKLEVSPKKSNDAINEPPNKRRSLNRRKMYTPRRFISPEAAVNQTDAKPSNSGGSKEGHSDQRVGPGEP